MFLDVEDDDDVDLDGEDDDGDDGVFVHPLSVVATNNRGLGGRFTREGSEESDSSSSSTSGEGSDDGEGSGSGSGRGGEGAGGEEGGDGGGGGGESGGDGGRSGGRAQPLKRVKAAHRTSHGRRRLAAFRQTSLQPRKSVMAREFRARNAMLAGIFHRAKHTQKPKPKIWLLRLINNLVKDKINVDALLDKNGLPHSNMPEFIYKHLKVSSEVVAGLCVLLLYGVMRPQSHTHRCSLPHTKNYSLVHIADTISP